MELIPIEPRKIRLWLLGHRVELTVTAASSPDARDWLSTQTVTPEELGDICCELCLHHMQGTFEVASGQLFTLGDREPVRYAGVWQVIPDYELFFRIYRWWYNFDLDEALSKQSFEETFGAWKGGHYYEKWLSNERSISRMIGYFGEDTAKGRQFLDMVMEKVQLYEQRSARGN